MDAAGVVVAEVKIVAVKIRVTKPREAVPKTQGQDTRGTRWPGTPTCPHSSPASAIGNWESQLIFVWNQALVHGKTSGYLRPTIDSLTSSTKRLTKNYYIPLNIKIKFKKYTRVS